MIVTAQVGRLGAAEPAKEEVKTAPEWQIRRFSVGKEGAQVTLEKEGGDHLSVLKSTGKEGNRLVSATFTAESGELKVEAEIGGVHHTLVRKAAELDKPATDSSRGPTEEDRKKYESLSEKGRAKFREALRAKFSDESFRNLPEEERRATIRTLFEKVAKEEQGADEPKTEAPKPEAGSLKAPTPPKEKRGPNEEDLKRYEAFSEKAREKLRDAMRDKLKDPAFRDAPEEERRAAVKAIFEKIEKEDQEGR